MLSPVEDGDSSALPAPARELDHTSPETLPQAEPATGRALLLEGLGFERWGLRKALRARGFDCRSSAFMKRRIATAVRYFPATLEEARQYELIVLGAVDAFALSDEGVAILKDYVRSGGSLMVCGGLYSYGGGRFKEFGLDSLLPLRVEETFDLMEPAQAPDWALDAEALNREALPAWPRIPWMHDLRLAEGATAWARVGERPFLATRSYGRGQVAAVAGTPLGPDEAMKRFRQSGAWQAALDALIVSLRSPHGS